MSGTLSDYFGCLIMVGLQERILLPTADGYATRIDSYFNNGAKLMPACILMPESTAEVATAIKALVGAGTKFAIRSGGSNFWPSNNITDGVTIDLGRLNSVFYDAETETAKIGAGVLAAQVCPRWAFSPASTQDRKVRLYGALKRHERRLTRVSPNMKGLWERPVKPALALLGLH